MTQSTKPDARTRKLKFWMFGIFVLVFAAVTAVMTMVSGKNFGLVFSQLNYWLMIGATAVLCILGYFVLKAVGGKK
jgi:uncharacterized membrane protein YhaH (DUF805 family)